MRSERVKALFPHYSGLPEFLPNRGGFICIVALFYKKLYTNKEIIRITSKDHQSYKVPV